ncbi:hypothetical protein FGSG_04628 [Fusarium graminearum PH-1]|uniref:hypothetical protein n=1 Tax=Gibberella zeae (strain ATCC MYA-4620 / CBS 123657 / FGSC 9075 / NRRL 31084 / PH-1) TaxID=229533 RepID=UPI00021F1A93|nr:hypothetical protein FGSG_04628 [Fusarium graminearum PH-1]ESU08446.1 hypothetical protein FGSG_04628 [Fusarium graminearum PH-1]|eukprot:XP_011320945.1 hypothetical protein FGSG_04628 [Fusarium graminearum PH-1]
MAYNAKPQPNLDGLGIFFIIWTFIWTFIVIGGMVFLWRRRDMPMLRIRDLPLTFVAIMMLHLYWGAIQTGYVYFPLFTPEGEYWIMSLYFPIGIALFHASNSRFLHVAKQQKELFASDEKTYSRPRARRDSWLGKFQALDYTKKILVTIGFGMTIQFILTIIMWCISRKFHHSWGVVGTEVHPGTKEYEKSQIGKGWEWWPSVFWQFIWAWMVAPYILWQSRGINDTQGWRTQTIACCIANLHATPMWLVALLAISIMAIEIFTIFWPCWEVLQHQTLRQETLDSIAQWQLNKKAVTHGAQSVATGSTTVAASALTSWSKDGSVKSSASGESILTMEALEYVLERNPEPLQQFSALRDFSGENIAFLRAVAEWKSSLPPSVRDPEKIKEPDVQELVRERFNSALRIYTSFISSRDAEFQINLSSQQQRKLETVFEESARSLFGDKGTVDPALPFETFQMTTTANKVKSSAASTNGSETGIMSTESVNDSGNQSDKALYWGDIPEGFDATIFDDSEGHIKYLVLTNTWPKFVKDRRCSIDSNDTLEDGNGIPAGR